MIGEEFLGERLVACQDEAARVAAGVGKPQQLEVADHVLIERGDAGECLHQVEDNVRLEEAGSRTNRAELVVKAKHAQLVAHFPQGLDDVVLHLPFGFAHVDPGGVRGRDQVVVHEREDPKLFHT